MKKKKKEQCFIQQFAFISQSALPYSNPPLPLTQYILL